MGEEMMTPTESLLLARIMLLRAAIRAFLDGYMSRTAKQEGIALRKLEKAMEETWQ